MDYLALYRKYRPKELDEVVGQSEIKKILSSSLKNGTITHAYLFSGPRGTGKTTMAKIFAKMVNCLEPIDGHACGKCESCLNILNSNDIIEIDAASNNGVDEIRELREKANLVPNQAKYKVYIIDEVHMLTTQAFNALLKTLEEPPKHVIFILATTEYYKIPLTITSRCQKFQFSKLTVDDIVNRLKEISNQEKIEITDDALYEIAKISDGGMRDSINFLDQLRSFTSNKITIDDVYFVCGNVSNQEIVDILDSLKQDNAEKITEFFENIDKKGKNYGKFFEDFVEFLKDLILYKKNVNRKYIKSNVDMLEKVNQLYTENEIYLIISDVNELVDRIKNTSRQSVTVVANFLLLMHKINLPVDSNKKVVDSVKEEPEYDMAFNFTEEVEKDDSTDDDNSENMTLSDNENVENNFLKFKNVIINNTFAVASKTVKNSLQKNYTKVNDYLVDKKYKSVAGLLIDTNIEVAGKEYILLSAKTDIIVNKIYDNYKLCLELINIIFDGEYNFAVVTALDWNTLRDEYIERTKSGKKYELMEFDNQVLDETPKEKKQVTVVDKLFDLVGEDIVEFK